MALSRVKQLAGFRPGKVGHSRVGQADVNVVRAVPGRSLVRADHVLVDAVALGVHGEVEDVVDLLEEQPLILDPLSIMSRRGN
jgi:hypothetical protein